MENYNAELENTFICNNIDKIQTILIENTNILLDLIITGKQIKKLFGVFPYIEAFTIPKDTLFITIPYYRKDGQQKILDFIDDNIIIKSEKFKKLITINLDNLNF